MVRRHAVPRSPQKHDEQYSLFPIISVAIRGIISRLQTLSTHKEQFLVIEEAMNDQSIWRILAKLPPSVASESFLQISPRWWLTQKFHRLGCRDHIFPKTLTPRGNAASRPFPSVKTLNTVHPRCRRRFGGSWRLLASVSPK